MTGPGDKHGNYAWDSKIYHIYNPITYRVVERRNLTFVETPAYSTVTPDVQSPLDEMENIDYATNTFTFTSLWDNEHNSSIAESEARDDIFNQVREARRHNV